MRRIIGKALAIIFLLNATYNLIHVPWCIMNLFSEYWVKAWSTPVFAILCFNISAGKKIARDLYIIFYVVCFVHTTISMAHGFADGYYQGQGQATLPMYIGAGVANLLFLLIIFWCLYGWPMRDIFNKKTEKQKVQPEGGTYA